MIGGFSGEDLRWLTQVTVQLQSTVRLQLSDYLEQNTAVYAPSTFEEIVIMINLSRLKFIL